MKYILCILIALIFINGTCADANVIFDLYGENSNASSLALMLDDQAGPLNYTLEGITATFSTPDGKMNRTDSGFGINGSMSGDDTDALDYSDALDISFNTDVTITRLDFRGFTTGESITISIGSITDGTFTPSTTYTLAESELDDQTYDYEENLEWTVNSSQTLRLTTTNPTDNIALDSIAVIPEPASIALILSSGMTALIARRFLS